MPPFCFGRWRRLAAGGREGERASVLQSVWERREGLGDPECVGEGGRLNWVGYYCRWGIGTGSGQLRIKLMFTFEFFSFFLPNPTSRAKLVD